jgi:hypothetical protein
MSPRIVSHQFVTDRTRADVHGRENWHCDTMPAISYYTGLFCTESSTKTWKKQPHLEAHERSSNLGSLKPAAAVQRMRV